MRLRRFLISEPMSGVRVAAHSTGDEFSAFFADLRPLWGYRSAKNAAAYAEPSVGGRLTARHQVLVLRMGVRFLPPERCANPPPASAELGVEQSHEQLPSAHGSGVGGWGRHPDAVRSAEAAARAVWKTDAAARARCSFRAARRKGSGRCRPRR